MGLILLLLYRHQLAPMTDFFHQIRGVHKITHLEKPDALKQAVPYVGEVMLGHVRYGTFGKNSLESVHPFLRQNNWMHRNLIVASRCPRVRMIRGQICFPFVQDVKMYYYLLSLGIKLYLHLAEIYGFY